MRKEDIPFGVLLGSYNLLEIFEGEKKKWEHGKHGEKQISFILLYSPKRGSPCRLGLRHTILWTLIYTSLG